MAIWGWWDKPIYDASGGSAWLWLYGNNGDKPVHGVSGGAPGNGYMGVVGVHFSMP